MNRLEEARKRINEIDREMARLYEMRMKAVADVARYKMENGLPVLDAAREREVIARNLALIENPDLVPYYVDFLSATMKSSREYQRDTLLASGQIDSRLEIKTERFSYPVHFLPGGLSKIGELFPLDRKVLILTDNGIPKEYVRTVSEACREAII